VRFVSGRVSVRGPPGSGALRIDRSDAGKVTCDPSRTAARPRRRVGDRFIFGQDTAYNRDGGAIFAMKNRMRAFLAVSISLAFLLTPLTGFAASTALSTSNDVSHLSLLPGDRVGGPVTAATSTPFAFVSNFENDSLGGWTSIRGTAPTIVSSPSYSGEPSLASTTKSGVQADYVTQNITADEGNVSLHVAIDAVAKGVGLFGLATAAHTFVAVVGVSDGNVVAGPNPAHLTTIEAVPNDTAQPAGWVLIIANVVHPGASSSMKVFVDRTDVVAATVKVPGALNYSGAMIETTHGSVHYSDVIVSTYQMATRIPGYNNMEGYGQGSALLVTKLPEFDNYTATMTLKNWSVPQSGILSFQINAMNLTGTTVSTCDGFFQLGLSLDKGGKISPWYVPGVNCESTNFVGSVATPADSVLVLSIVWENSTHQIRFSIDDTTLGKTWTHSIAYKGGGFYGAYTQMEFQPCCNSSPIGDYVLSGELSNMVITTIGGSVQSLPASYMLPFMLDAPPTWDLGYYQNAHAAYDETS
jgi:hypothetical protein